MCVCVCVCVCVRRAGAGVQGGCKDKAESGEAGRGSHVKWVGLLPEGRWEPLRDLQLGSVPIRSKKMPLVSLERGD